MLCKLTGRSVHDSGTPVKKQLLAAVNNIFYLNLAKNPIFVEKKVPADR